MSLADVYLGTMSEAIRTQLKRRFPAETCSEPASPYAVMISRLQPTSSTSEVQKSIFTYDTSKTLAERLGVWLITSS